MTGRAGLLIAAAGVAAFLAFAKKAGAAEPQPARVYVLWDETRDAAWLSPKGLTATSTNATACALATAEAAKYAPAGTRLACRKVVR